MAPMRSPAFTLCPSFTATSRLCAYADSHSSARYTIVDIIASNTLGLLHRVSRLMSSHGCEVDLVLISTEGQKAIDVFHITKGGAKLAEEAQRALTADLQRLLEGHDEAD